MDSASRDATHDALAGRYARIAEQLAELFANNSDAQSRMATSAAVLHHKMPHYFWTGFYRLHKRDLIVGPYQGPLACSILERGVGVCWACIEQGVPIIVPNVHEYPGHIPCDSRSNSEVVIPLHDSSGKVVGVLDVDSSDYDAFSDVDVEGLSRIVELIYS